MDAISAALCKTEDSVRLKCRRLGLSVEEDSKGYTTSSLNLRKELLSVEETQITLAGALQAANKAGLDKVEVQRLQVVATLTRTYKRTRPTEESEHVNENRSLHRHAFCGVPGF